MYVSQFGIRPAQMEFVDESPSGISTEAFRRSQERRRGASPKHSGSAVQLLLQLVAESTEEFIFAFLSKQRVLVTVAQN